MPVPRNGFEGEMVFSCKVTFEHPEPDDGEHDGTDADMHTVEAGQHKKRRPVNP